MKRGVRLLAYLGVLTAQAMVLNWIESLLPVLPIQGPRLGLANIVTLVAAYTPALAHGTIDRSGPHRAGRFPVFRTIRPAVFPVGRTRKRRSDAAYAADFKG